MLQKIKSHLLTHWKKYLLVLILMLALFSLVPKIRDLSSKHSGYLLLGDPDKIIIVESNSESEVVIIGDPEKVNVKPKHKK